VNGLLLDTHALLWMVLDDPRLSRRARSEIEKAGRLVYSMASFWEIALKLSKGGFDIALPDRWHQELVAELRRIGSVRVEIQPDHCRRLQDLPWHHNDPFDRMLIAQAEAEEVAILTADRRFKKYGVKVLW
jgi:PIN domain nuclease of toxin-antitoxin system